MGKKIICFVLFLLNVSLLVSNNYYVPTDSINLYPSGCEINLENPEPEHWVNISVHKRLVYHVTKPYLFPFIVDSLKTKRPAVIICPGGAYEFLSIDYEGFNVAQWFQKRGISAFVLKYRLPIDYVSINEPTVALKDLEKAIYYVRKNASKLGIDSTKIGVVGFSAGGHLAALASVHYKHPLINVEPQDIRPDFSILLYPMISTRRKYASTVKEFKMTKVRVNPIVKRILSADRFVNKNTPPAFILAAKNDTVVKCKNSILYAKRCTKKKVSNQLVLLEKGGHGFGISESSKVNYWTLYLEAWLINMELISY